MRKTDEADNDLTELKSIVAAEFSSLMAYISEMSAELASMARLAGSPRLALQLEDARQEALASLKRGRLERTSGEAA